MRRMLKMDEQETQTTNIFPIFMAICFSLTVGFGIGYTWKSSKDKSATVIYDETVRIYREMQSAAGYMSHPEAMTQRMEVQNTDEGIGYIEIHYIPRAALPKLHEDIGNPEVDGHKPSSKEADDWATKNESR
jgi:hypothetical protein